MLDYVEPMHALSREVEELGAVLALTLLICRPSGPRRDGLGDIREVVRRFTKFKATFLDNTRHHEKNHRIAINSLSPRGSVRSTST
jgi:hypothetical protein